MKKIFLMILVALFAVGVVSAGVPGCDVANADCTKAGCLGAFPKIGWMNYYGVDPPVVINPLCDSNNIRLFVDSTCDSFGVSGSNNKDCAGVGLTGPPSIPPLVICPSYERLGHLVGESDCLGTSEDKYLYFHQLNEVNLGDPFFAGPQGGGEQEMIPEMSTAQIFVLLIVALTIGAVLLRKKY